MKTLIQTIAIALLALNATPLLADHASDSAAEYAEEMAEHCSHVLDEISTNSSFRRSVPLMEDLEEAANHFHDEILESDGDWGHIGEDFQHFKEAYTAARSVFRREAREYARRTGERHIWSDWNDIYHQYRQIKSIVRRNTRR